MEKPSVGITVDADLVKVKDADTVRVRVTYEFDVRLIHPNEDGLEFNAPEKNTIEGQLALDYVSQYEGQKIRLHIPTGRKGNELIDFTSFVRVLGIVWTNTGLLTKELLDKGFAGLYKRGTY